MKNILPKEEQVYGLMTKHSETADAPIPEGLSSVLTVIPDIIYGFDGSSLKCMGNSAWNMIDIRHQKIEEVKTDHYERYGTISVSIGVDIAMACGVV